MIRARTLLGFISGTNGPPRLNPREFLTMLRRASRVRGSEAVRNSPSPEEKDKLGME